MRLARIHLAMAVLFAGIAPALPAGATEHFDELEASPLAYRDEVLVASGIEMERLIEHDFVAFDPTYKERRKPRGELRAGNDAARCLAR